MDKTMTLKEAIASHVRDGDLVAIEGFGHLVPVAAAHEIIRQGFRHLTLARMTGDALIDQMLAGGCLKGIIASFIGNSSAGSLHELRRRVEKADPAKVELEEYSHGGMVCRYVAGASKLPFHPINSYRGSDLVKLNTGIRSVIDPYSGKEIHVVPALNPDVTIIHAQRADRSGNVQAWGMLGIQTEAAYSAKKVIVTVEEIVEDVIVRSDPNRTIVPSHAVDAVVECPRGAHPHSVQGYYDRDDAFSRQWSELAREPAELRRWMDEHIFGTDDHAEYLDSLGADCWKELRVGEALSTPVNYGGRK